VPVSGDSTNLYEHRLWLKEGDFATSEEAFGAAEVLIESYFRADRVEPLRVIGDFVLAPIDGPASRDFQTLHFDFGIPLDPMVPQDIARYTALYVAPDTVVTGVTRLVPLAPLLGQRDWPDRSELLARFVAYGQTHGARDDETGYVEGSFARIIDAAATHSPFFASVKTDPDFLCGLEFDTLSAEVAFFQRHGLNVEDVETDICIGPGGLLVFDNLAVAHGRRGRRQPGELHQRMLGYPQMSPVDQLAAREGFIDAFYAAAGSMVSVP
jgi:hypothetical protein